MSTPFTIAEKLLDAGAVKLSPNKPFKWASGWYSPIYCDNRKLLSFPDARDIVKKALCKTILKEMEDVELIAGVATAGIPWGALVADKLKLPYIYVRPKPKEHGLGNQIEGVFKSKAKVVMVEDLISTGKSSIDACKVLLDEKLKLLGVISIFNYGFPQAIEAFAKEDIPFFSLSNYQVMIDRALDRELVTEQQIKKLLKWQTDPENWKK
jgi:orotate phosphoribosyltransferase